MILLRTITLGFEKTTEFPSYIRQLTVKDISDSRPNLCTVRHESWMPAGKHQVEE
jgi:hypothetical protein